MHESIFIKERDRTMIPEKGQHVKCIMRSSLVLEGVIEEWTNDKVVLRSLEDDSFMIIHQPAQDIVITKIIIMSQNVEKPKNQAEYQKQIKEKLEEIPSDPELRDKNIGDLRRLVIEQERQIIANKKREHFGTAGAAKMTQYSSPYMPGKIPSNQENENDSPYKPGKIK